MKYEYKIVPIPASVNTIAKEDIINLLGQQGWELVSVMAIFTDTICYFKREANGQRKKAVR